MERFESYSRITGDDRFRWIAEANLQLFDSLNPKVMELRDKISEVLSSCDDPHNPPEKYHDLSIELHPIEEERDQACIVSVVFTAMYFEAFIYDYAASCLGDNYAKDHLDKLDFISKWLVIPRLITGKELSKEGQAYQCLKRLHKDRNSLVHLKSRELVFNNDEMVKYLQDREIDIQESVGNCRSALKHVISELLVIDPDHPKVQLSNESHNNRIN